jgi:hypothetical protein
MYHDGVSLKSPKLNPVEAVRSAVQVHDSIRRWLRFFR